MVECGPSKKLCSFRCESECSQLQVRLLLVSHTLFIPVKLSVVLDGGLLVRRHVHVCLFVCF